MKKLIEKVTSSKDDTKNKKKIENIVFLIIILIITIVIINTIWKKEEVKSDENLEDTNTFGKMLASKEESTTSQKDLEKQLEKILSTIKNVGKVNVLINYSESSSIVPLYDEGTTTSTTEEEDSSGGTRTTTQTEAQKEIIFSEGTGSKQPVTQKTIMPTIQGAIITAEGANDATVKTNIVNAVAAITGLSIEKIQVFETEL